MKRSSHFLLALMCISLVICCSKKTNSIAVAALPVPTLDYTKINSDSSLIAEFLAYKNQLSKIDSAGANYYDGKILYPKNATFKVLNVMGEVSGGATYNPFAKSYIYHKEKIQKSSIEGETFRVDKKNDSTYLFYVDNFWRLGSNINVYEILFSKDSLLINETNKHANYAFDLMNNHKESPRNFPKNINDLFPKPNPNYQPNDTTSIAFDGNYYPDELFMERNGVDFSTQLYYKTLFGDEIQKVVRIAHNNSIYDITLAMIGGDSNSYELSSEFVNDSIFITTQVNGETIKDDNERMAYAYDSIIKKYKYNQFIELQLIEQDTFKYEKEYYSEFNQRKEKHTLYSKPFKINDISCYWITELELRFDDKKQVRKGKNLNRRLVNSITKKVILTTDEDTVLENFTSGFDSLTENFFDFDFDGYLDFSIHNYNKSGASNSFYDNFLFNPKTKQFDYNKDLSGAEITIDKKLRTVHFFYKSGINNHLSKTIYYDGTGKVLFTENIKTEDVLDKKSNEWHIKRTYTKIKNGKIIEQKAIKEE
jgi:hypothetical protein